MAIKRSSQAERDHHGSSQILFFLCTLALVAVGIDGAALNDSSVFYYELASTPSQQSAIDIVLQSEPATVNMVRFDKGKLLAKAANLTAISWAHAVNSQQLLSDALSGDIDMIEADIVLGQLNGEGDNLPVMAHPPANISDLTLEDFLYQIKAHNEVNEGAEKGVKLDFKSIEVFEGALDILDETIPKMTYPIWINADILAGPVDQNRTVPVDPARFFAGCNRYKQAVLSIGWTTNWGADFRDGEYTQSQCDAMLQAIRDNNVTSTGQPITFPVRAGIAANSIEQLHNLVAAVNDTNESTLTIWSSENDYVNVERLRQLIFGFGVERVYLDVPEELSSQLDLGNTDSGASTFNSLVSFSFISICFWAISSWLKSV
ncbi:protein FAM151B isoform X1 [Drosophila sulfurigaster albostrigata]|uniref:protein FAM151B isoform X1 n=2 Tax=Drosophila sulfurigaster albostrigata TaxID=89887 RepID=UPI002D21A61D|nr:protein FAM151B isoform X1 [Drosophila sulfurigaster albostrigata]